MSWASTSWLFAANFGVDESLDDEGFHTWNCNLGSLHQHPNKNNGSPVQGNLGSPSYLDVSCSSIIARRIRGMEKLKQWEEPLRIVMYLSCWGPNSQKQKSLLVMFQMNGEKQDEWLQILWEKMHLVVLCRCCLVCQRCIIIGHLPLGSRPLDLRNRLYIF